MILTIIFCKCPWPDQLLNFHLLSLWLASSNIGVGSCCQLNKFEIMTMSR